MARNERSKMMPARRRHGRSTSRRKAAINGKRKDELVLLLALARGETTAAAARQAGFAERTAHRRLQDRAFMKQVRELRSQMLDQAVGRLADATCNAIETLRLLLDADSEMARLGAARVILDQVINLRENHDFEQRIVRLESNDGVY